MKFTISRVAQILEAPEGTVRVWADKGLLPCERTSGGMRIFDEADVNRMAAERLAKRTSLTGQRSVVRRRNQR